MGRKRNRTFACGREGNWGDLYDRIAFTSQTERQNHLLNIWCHVTRLGTEIKVWNWKKKQKRHFLLYRNGTSFRVLSKWPGLNYMDYLSCCKSFLTSRKPWQAACQNSNWVLNACFSLKLPQWALHRWPFHS